MFSSLQARIMRTAISPRLATKTFSNMGKINGDPRLATWRSKRPHLEHGLAELHWFCVINQNLGNNALHLGLDFVHHFHRFDKAHDSVRSNFRAYFDVGTG